ncbi:MAG: histidine phosphatase family protein, partial [Arenicella sp.]|nr:histidine phosphatase family protein [Arenicella sp.]
GLDIPQIEQDERWNELESELQVKLLAPRLENADTDIEQLLKNAHSDKKAFQKLIRATFSHWIEAGETEPELESWTAAHARATGALADVHVHNGSGSRVAVFSSGGIIAVIAAHVLGLPPSGVYPLFEKVINCSITRLLHNAESIALSTFNEHSYLQAIADHADQGSVITYR